MDLDWGFIAIFFVLSFPTTVVLLTVDSIYLGNKSVHVSALNPWVLSLVNWLLLNKSFYFSRLSVVSSFLLTLSLSVLLSPSTLGASTNGGIPWPCADPLQPKHPPLWDPCLRCQLQAAHESEVPCMLLGLEGFQPFHSATAQRRLV